MMRSKPLHAATAWARVATAGVALFATALLGLTSLPERSGPPRTITPVASFTKRAPTPEPSVVDSSGSKADPGPRSMLHVQGPTMIVEVTVPRSKPRATRRGR
jgi:hypothetical protein